MVKNVLVTGAKGFIGKNLVVRLKELEYQVIEYDVESSDQELPDAIKQADFIFHLAGVNRPKNEDEFFLGNSDLTKDVLNQLTDLSKQVPIVLSSSIQADFDNPYGLSKRRAEEAVFEHIEAGYPGLVVRLHNVFGKWCRPNYNSVVATFCYNISHQKPIEITNPEHELGLVYIDDVVNAFISYIDYTAFDTAIRYVKPRHAITLAGLADRLKLMYTAIRTGVLPDLSDPLSKKLLSTLLSYFDSSDIISNPEVHSDDRGHLFELIKGETFGQIFVSTTKPGITRGNHYHHTKVEKFCVISGEGVVSFRHIISDERFSVNLDGRKPQVLNIPPGYTHNITNVGDSDMITLFWANEVFETSRPDTIYREV
jgi:UDP-2-acetamido-2,6-beta-L-arabino-hexul-4-ose reductase